MTSRLHVKPGQTISQAVAEQEEKERSHQRSTMTFELGLDYIVLNGYRILRPSGVARSSWEKFWAHNEHRIIDLH